MKRVILLVFLFLCSTFYCNVGLASSVAHDADVPTKDDKPRIVGGTPASKGEYPWFTMLRYASGNFDFKIGCGGMLISEEWVLTAAHCINSNMMNNGAVRVGAFKAPYRQDGNGGQPVEYFLLKSIIVHPDYNSRTENNDFALLRLDGISTITPVPLDSSGLSDSYITGKSNLWIMGHGNTDFYSGDPTTTLSHAKVKYVSNIDCTTKYSYDKKQISENMMCARDDGKDSCEGDSGGPLYDKDNDMVVGVISWGIGCASPEFPGVYARISAQYDWIKDIVCNNSSRQPAWCGNLVQSPSVAPIDPPVKAPPPSGCVDSSLRFKVYFNGKYRYKSCNWIKTNSKKRCWKYGVRDMCPSACGTCDTCSDSPVRFKVIIKEKNKSRDCNWANNWRCKIYAGVSESCRLTCGTCSV